MTPQQFIAKWQDATLTERAAAQEHFIDLCRLLGEPTPAEADPDGLWYCFEKGATKAGGGEGWADVWRRRCFAWEYKGKGKDLKAAFRQLQLYTPALEYPPVLIVSDLARIELHTAFTGHVPVVHVLTLADLAQPDKLRLLKWAFSDPERLRPGDTTAALTEAAAARFGELALRLRGRGHDPQAVGHFCIRLLFCLFAEDIDLLPGRLFTRLLDAALARPAHLPDRSGDRGGDRISDLLADLFAAMAGGGRLGLEPVPWFNGGLFDSADTLPLTHEDCRTLRGLAGLDWSAVEPSIFGTLFERGLDPDKRSQLGAHYTDPQSILRLIDPVLLAPLRDEWTTRRADIAAQMARAGAARTPAARTRAVNAAAAALQTMLARLRGVRVLDPACGSGNFLLLALTGLKDLEHRVILEAEALGLPRALPLVGPENLLGFEINPYAAELARVTVWIGEIQWMLAHGFSIGRDPILKPLNTIEQRDAILNPDGTEPAWPAADVILGNPPFLGDKKMQGLLGGDYVARLRACYRGRVPGGADLVTYWFERARAAIAAGHSRYAGLVATNSIRGGANRRVLERIADSGALFAAWADEPWINEGAAVRVSLVAFGPRDHDRPLTLDGLPVAALFPDLTAAAADGAGADVTGAVRLRENAGVSFMGVTKSGPFDVPGELARKWLGQPNPHCRPNLDVLWPSYNGRDLVNRHSGEWIIHFGTRTEADAALYEAPFEHAVMHIKPARQQSRTARNREIWWQFERPRPEMFAALHQLPRYIATSLVAKHRIFQYLPMPSVPENVVIVIARADDTTFGILHSRIHEVWSLRLCTWLGKGNDPRYTPTTTFETFPFPAGLTPADTAVLAGSAGAVAAPGHSDQGRADTLAAESRPHAPDGLLLPAVASEYQAAAQAIARAAARLNALRAAWLNPPEWVEQVPEVVPGWPARLLPRPGHAADLKQRTLTNLYNARPAWLVSAHQALDAAVAAAYGWDPTDLTDEDRLLRRLLALNRARADGG